uniref:Uncharacterized protein n=1 Tax=Heterorhabditis bacteriophora TaxID=37862 RepID=A0A1I7X8C1_HETBA
MAAVNSHTSTRLPLSLAPRNRNLPVPGKLTRQVGKSNLLVLNDKTQNIGNNADPTIAEPLKENTCLGIRPIAIATRSRPIAPLVKGSFEVFCDDDVENNIIHQLEKRCNDEEKKKKHVEKTVKKSPLKKQQSRPARKPLSSIASQHYDLDLDDDAPSGATTMRSEFSNFGVDDVEDTQSSHYGSALDYELDSKDEYMTAQSEKEAHEDLIYCNPEFSKDVYR